MIHSITTFLLATSVGTMTVFTTIPPRKNPIGQEVIDWVAVDEADGYIDHYDVKVTKSMRIKAKCIKQLKQLGLRHHVLGKTFPHPMGGIA